MVGAEVHRIAGELAPLSPEPVAAKAEAYFERALAVARKQEAKSGELRAATSMARLWRDQGKRKEARALLAPIYGWFTEGFDTRDLKDVKALLGELRPDATGTGARFGDRGLPVLGPKLPIRDVRDLVANEGKPDRTRAGPDRSC